MDEEFKARLQLYTLYNYVAQNWGHHARAASSNVGPVLLDFLESEAKVSSSIQALMIFGNSPGYSQFWPKQLRGVHLTAYFGLEEAMIVLLKNGHDPDSEDDDGRAPLSLAAENGHEAVVKELLTIERVNADSKDYYTSQTPLSIAAERGHEAVVKQLLATAKVNPDSMDSNGWTLSWAAENGLEAVAQLLATERSTWTIKTITAA